MFANKVIYGNIVTMNEKQPRAQAMAIIGHRNRPRVLGCLRRYVIESKQS